MPGFNPTNAISNSRRLDIVPLFKEFAKVTEIQIAAKGNTHYKVFKTVLGDNTVSELKLLTNEERIIEIAEMLSGKDISDSALNHAKALLN
jgi:DNA repair ATPase RecN